MHPQHIIIFVSLLVGSFYAEAARTLEKRQYRLLLVFATFLLYAVAIYELYMSFIWEKHLHAAIRLEIPILEVPLIVGALILGGLAVYFGRA